MQCIRIQSFLPLFVVFIYRKALQKHSNRMYNCLVSFKKLCYNAKNLVAISKKGKFCRFLFGSCQMSILVAGKSLRLKNSFL